MQNMGGAQAQGGKNVCKCPHHNVVPIMIILIGLTFLLGALNIVLTPWAVSVIWPILLIIIGGIKLGSKKCKCC